jgi:hypothetical protein
VKFIRVGHPGNGPGWTEDKAGMCNFGRLRGALL